LRLVGLVLLLTWAANADNTYIKVTKGSSCERLKSREECKDAARQLKLLDNNAKFYTEDSATEEPGCYFFGDKHLIFNKNSDETTECKAQVCICKKSSEETEHVVATNTDTTTTTTSKPTITNKPKIGSTDESTDDGTDDSTDDSEANEGCCSKVFIDYTRGHDTSEAFRLLPDIYRYTTNFTKEKDEENLYKSNDKKYAMWRTLDEEHWMVGEYRKRHTYTAFAYVKSVKKCPNEINYDWKYLNGDSFKAAYKGMSVYCI